MIDVLLACAALRFLRHIFLRVEYIEMKKLILTIVGGLLALSMLTPANAQRGGGNRGGAVHQGAGVPQGNAIHHGRGAHQAGGINLGGGGHQAGQILQGVGVQQGSSVNHGVRVNHGVGSNRTASPNYGIGGANRNYYNNQWGGNNQWGQNQNNHWGRYNQWGQNNFNYGGYGQGFGRNGGFGQNYDRYGQSPIAALIFSQFPSASRLLSSRSYGNGGAWFRNNGGYYYYPQSVISTYAYPQTQIVNGAMSAPVVSQQAPAPTAIEFGGFAHVAELTGMLPVVANDLCLDMHYNYQGNAGFDSAYRDAFALLQSTKSLQAAHQTGNKDAVRAEVRNLDVLLHRVEEQTLSWTRQEQRQIGELGLLAKLEVSADMTHHLMYDVGIQPDPDQHNPGPATERPAQ
jgi:hypothetical protein